MSPIYARKASPADSEEIPEEPDRIFGRFSGDSTARVVMEVWGAEETTPGNWDATRMWRVPEPPDGVAVDLEQTQIQGGDVEASWINSTNDFDINVQWEVNSSVHSTVTRPAGSTSALLDESELSQSDEVRARMRYFEGGVTGEWGPWSDPLTYQA